MSEIALVSARKSRLESAYKRGSSRAKAALDLANSPNRFLSTVQIGITLIGILTGIYSGENITTNLNNWITRFELLQPYAHTLSVTLIVIFITFLSLILGELVPKRIGLANPELIAGWIAAPMNIISKITAPFVWLLTICTDLIVKAFGIKQSEESKVTEEEIKAIIQEGTNEGEIQEVEQNIVERVFYLGDRKVSSLMTHRSDVIMLHLNTDAVTVKKVVDAELHSVYPVYRETIDKIEGVVLLKDLFKHINDADFNLSKYVKVVNKIVETTPVYHALEVFKKTGKQYAIVTDEQNQMQGIITMNDMLTSLIGNVDEFYKDEFQITKRDDGTFLVDGNYPFHEFLMNFDFQELANDYEHNTLAGLIIHELEAIPNVGDKLKWQQFEFEIADMDGTKIDKVLVTLLH